MAVAAGNHQAQERRFQIRVAQIVCAHVAFNMVDAHQRFSRREGQTLHAVDAGQQRTDQSRSLCDRQGVHFLQTHACFPQRLVHYPVAGFHMGPAGNLRHHTAIEFVQVNLAEHHIAQDLPAVLNYGCRGFIAAGLQGEDADSFLVPQLLSLQARFQFIIHHSQFIMRMRLSHYLSSFSILNAVIALELSGYIITFYFCMMYAFSCTKKHNSCSKNPNHNPDTQ